LLLSEAEDAVAVKAITMRNTGRTDLIISDSLFKDEI
jgi:hypothetical protein